MQSYQHFEEAAQVSQQNNYINNNYNNDIMQWLFSYKMLDWPVTKSVSGVTNRLKRTPHVVTFIASLCRTDISSCKKSCQHRLPLILSVFVRNCPIKHSLCGNCHFLWLSSGFTVDGKLLVLLNIAWANIWLRQSKTVLQTLDFSLKWSDHKPHTFMNFRVWVMVNFRALNKP